MSHKSISLFVPGLLELAEAFKHLPAADTPALKNLQRFLSRAEKKPVDIHDWHDGLASLFSFKKLPAAELRYQQYAGVSDKSFFCLCADPVFIQPDLNSAILLAHEELALSLEEAKQLVTAINEHFADEHWTLQVLQPHCWVMKSVQPFLVKTTALLKLIGQPVGNSLVQGEDRSYWQRIQNEIQMLLFAHPLNKQREQQGRPPVNSLWLWGEGALTESSTDWQCILGQGDLLDALIDNFHCVGIKTSLYEQLNIDATVHTLVASNEFESITQAQDIYAWVEALKQFENNWMPVVFDLLNTRKIDEINLLVGDGLQFKLNRKMSHRWWRKMKSLDTFKK
ncbi:Regulatory protein, RpfE type [hydrothermal vent metagenome]|uniref:Regulatory protein, RpfE type n=1 Tax=hydrothermal vent metagenome TaxID=652676 RepID=A0A3B1BJK6_9ZZZZ